MIALFLGLLIYLFWSLSRSKTGRAFRAIRERPEAASTMGIDVVAHRSLAFLLSALIAGAAGAFYAHSVGSLDNGDFRFTRAVDVLSYAVVGGAGQWFGPLLGAGLLTALPDPPPRQPGCLDRFPSRLRPASQHPDRARAAARRHVHARRPRAKLPEADPPARGPRGAPRDATRRRAARGPDGSGCAERAGGCHASCGAGPLPGLRRSGSTARREFPTPGGTHLRIDRSQRGGEDHVHQSRLGSRLAQLGTNHLAGQGDPGSSPPPYRSGRASRERTRASGSLPK